MPSVCIIFFNHKNDLQRVLFIDFWLLTIKKPYASYKYIQQHKNTYFSPLFSPNFSPNTSNLLLCHPQPPVTATSHCCLPLDHRIERNTLIRVKSFKTNLRIRYHSFFESSWPSLHNFFGKSLNYRGDSAQNLIFFFLLFTSLFKFKWD